MLPYVLATTLQFKFAQIIFISKVGNPSNDIKSHSPISFLPGLFKLLKRIKQNGRQDNLAMSSDSLLYPNSPRQKIILLNHSSVLSQAFNRVSYIGLLSKIKKPATMLLENRYFQTGFSDES